MRDKRTPKDVCGEAKPADFDVFPVLVITSAHLMGSFFVENIRAFIQT